MVEVGGGLKACGTTPGSSVGGGQRVTNSALKRVMRVRGQNGEVAARRFCNTLLIHTLLRDAYAESGR
jgi:hypothetical protein